MKNLFLFTLFMLAFSSLYGQKMAHDRYTISGGVLGALNVDRFRIGGDNTRDVGYRYQPGWAGGAWINLPVSYWFSVEPQVMYSKYNYESNSGSALLSTGCIDYISIPVSLKFDLKPYFALTVGPQIDLLANFDGYPNNLEKGDFSSTSLSVQGGFEAFPHGPLTVFGRYMHGLSNMDNTDNANADAEYFNTNIQFGLKVKLFGKVIPADTDGDGIADKSDNCPEVPGEVRYMGCPIPDSDGDGINDELDKCPQEPGVEKYDGCPVPDTDKDGINDDNDKCPKVAGFARYDGCPVPDTDGDGINDEDDKCPKEAGVAKYMGCPIPDSDGDGVNDERDKCPSTPGVEGLMGCPDRDRDGIADGDDRCPDVPGVASMQGCPPFSSDPVLFGTGSAALTSDARKIIKDAAGVLNDDLHKSLNVEVQGHADNTGSEKVNQSLSERRADAVKKALVKLGVDAKRVTTVGFGSAKPVGDNKTADGRKMNRRAEISVKM